MRRPARFASGRAQIPGGITIRRPEAVFPEKPANRNLEVTNSLSGPVIPAIYTAILPRNHAKTALTMPL
jgi:hypothetical protein